MNKTRIFIAFAVLLAAQPLPAAQAQEEERYRGLFLSHASSTHEGKPGAKINVELLRGKTQKFVPLDTVFRSGDKVKLHFEVNFPAYVTIYNLEPSGVKNRLFPYNSEKTQVQALKKYVVPSADEWFEFDDDKGTERLTFLFSSSNTTTSAAQPARPAPTKAKPQKNVVLVRSEEDDDQISEDDIDQQTEASRGLNRVKVGADQYYFGDTEKLRQRVVIRLNLKHE